MLLRRAHRRPTAVRRLDPRRGDARGEGIEHYDRFFRGLTPDKIDPIARLMAETGQVTSMICFSPDFTHLMPASGSVRSIGERPRST
jgi:hypothetical protein